ncbi:hypothetical protein C8J57DRAFT_1465958 [Mycena rebaudengoi]|nr:hypothetical protein C8J57DRAFT_1465958 [Mycena rebaudengoi]
MSVRMWLNIGVRRVDVLEHWGIDLHVKPRRHGRPHRPPAPAPLRLCLNTSTCTRICVAAAASKENDAGGGWASAPSVAGGVAVADAASGVPGDSAGSAGPRRRRRRRGSAPIHPHAPACHTLFLAVFPQGSGCVQEKAPGRHGARGRKQRWRGCTRVQAQDDKEPSTPSFRLDREVNNGRGGRKVSETTQIRGTIEKEDKTQMRLLSGSRAAERTLAQSDPSRNTALNPALNPISIRGKCENLNKVQGWPGPWPNPGPEISLQIVSGCTGKRKYAAEMKKLAPSKLQARNGPGYPVLVRIRSDHNDRSLMHESAKEVV